MSDDRKRSIGKVVSVASDRFVIEMRKGTDNFTVVGFDDVHYVARLGTFLLIPAQAQYVVAEVVGLRERDITIPGGRSDFDLAASAKYLDVVPVGMLPVGGGEFKFGVSTFPSLYADALYALDDELDRVFDTQQATEDPKRYRVLPIGKSVVFEDYDVKVRLDDFFGGHVAVLGNTGSGKSCTVASVFQSLLSKPDEYHARGATFVIFDVNGEYTRALAPFAKENQIGVHRLVIDGTIGGFRVPHWFLEAAEWEMLLQASEKAQLPVLRTALGLTSLMKDGSTNAVKIREHFMAKCIAQCFMDGETSVAKMQRVAALLKKYETPDLNISIMQRYGANYQYGNFQPQQNLVPFLDEIKTKVGEDITLPSYSRAPFSFGDLEECMDYALLYEEAHGNKQIRDYCSSMLTRLKALNERQEYAFIRHDDDDVIFASSEAEFLAEIVGIRRVKSRYAKQNQVIIIDMNSVEDEIVELVSAVVGRMLFRLLRQAEPRNGFPVHLVLEEAHRYIPSTPSRYSIDAVKIFERIAKEGRKYGMFLMLASQRPSELSKTVLSQCSNFVVHRIQNPDDLSQIRQMTPFISDAVLRRLPSLPKQHALVFGTSVNLPTTFKVRDADPRPKSDDTNIVDLWFHADDKLADIHFGPPPREGHDPGDF